jgi:hypothetical protein
MYTELKRACGYRDGMEQVLQLLRLMEMEEWVFKSQMVCGPFCACIQEGSGGQ